MTSTKETELWEVAYGGEDTAEADDEWLQAARGTWLCSACYHPLPGRPFEPVKLKYIPAKRVQTFSFIRRLLLSFGSTDLADEIMRLSNPGDFQFGRLILPDGKEAPDLVTFEGCRRVLIRGDERSRTRLCPECGRRLYAIFGKRYVMKSAMKGRRVAGCQDHGLTVDDESLPAIMQHLPKRGYGPWRLEIRETPIDGHSIGEEGLD